MEQLGHILSDLFWGSLSIPFYRMSLYSAILSLCLNALSFVVALYVISNISRNLIKISTFLIGLILVCSFSPLLKVLVLKEFFSNVKYLNLVLLYFFHLSALYILIYAFFFSLVSANTFSLISSYKIPFTVTLKYFFKKAKWIFVVFVSFSFTFILFDTSKSLIDNSLFSINILDQRYPSYLFSRFSFYIYTVPVLVTLFPAISVFVVQRERLYGRLIVEHPTSMLTPNISIDVFGYIKKLILQAKRFAKSYPKETILMISPWLVYLLLIAGFVKLFFPILGSLPILDKAYLSLFVKTISGAIIISFCVCLFFLFLAFVKSIKFVLLSTLFIVCLLPLAIVGYFVSHLPAIELSKSFLTIFEFRLIVGLTLSFGVFPFFFLTLAINEQERLITLLRVYKTPFLKRAEAIWEVLKPSFYIGLVVYAILLINDAIILEAIPITDKFERSFAYLLYERMSRSTQGINNNEMFYNAFYLVLCNMVLLLAAPIIHFFVRVFHFFVPKPIMFFGGLLKSSFSKG